MENTAENGAGIENLPITDEEIDTRGLLSTIRTALVGQCKSSNVQLSTVQQDVAMNTQLKAELVSIMEQTHCSAKDVERFSTTLNFMVNCCGYNLNDAGPFLLISAASNDNVAIVLTLLLDHNVRFCNTNEANHETILHIACRLKSALRYAYALLYPSLLSFPDNNGHLPIHIACQNNDVQFLSWIFNPILCMKGISSQYSCPVSSSSFIEAEIASKISPLLSSMKYIKLSAVTLTGRSVYHIAVSQGYSQLLGLLLDVLGATQDVFELDVVIAPDYENQLTPFRAAIALHETECVKLLLNFLDKHRLLQAVAQDKQVIKIATDVDDASIMKLLVKYGFSQGLEDAIGRVQDQQMKRLLLYYYTQLTSLQAIMDSQSDYKKGLKAGLIRWNRTSIEKLDLTWMNDCIHAMESISQAIRQAEVSLQSLYDLSTTQYLASACLSYFESEMLCTQQLDSNPLIPITVIDIACCSVKFVPPELFQLPSLEVLKLSNNCIQELPTALQSSQCMYSSQSLSTLVLDGNQLKTLPEDLFLGLVKSLKHLSVQKNELSELPPGLWVMPHLKELNLSGNKLSQLHYFCSDDTFNDHSFAEKVVMTINYCDEVCDLKTCTQKVVSKLSSDCKMRSPKEMDLQTLNEHCNLRRYIQRLEIFYKTLHLATNGKFFVKNVEEWIRFLHDQRGKEGRGDESDLESDKELPVLTFSEDFDTSVLFSLNLSHNVFTKLPEQLPCVAPKLENLYMSHNLIKSVDLVHNMPRNVVTVHLDHNLIEDMAAPQPQLSLCWSPSMLLLLQPRDSCCVHTAHVYLKSLASLMLGYNELKDFQAVDINSDLDEVENVVCSVVTHFPRLSILSLEHNKLSRVPSSIMNLTSLNSLNLAHNVDIVRLPNNLGLLSLSSLNLEGLSLAGIPINLVEKLSPRYLLSYLKGIVQGKVSYRHMKLMLVGSANAGKTTLLLELTKKGKMVHQRPVQMGVNGLPLSTVGVELGEWECAVAKNPPITFMTWDFGGQEEYYATHQCFISHRSLYLAIWDARDGEIGLRNMKTWLENIEARAPSAPVIMIGTHADCIKNVSALEEAFKKLYIEYNPSSFAYPKIQSHCFFVNSFNSSHMHQLRTYIYQFTQTYKNPGGKKDAIPLIDEPIPLYYMTILKIIQSLVRKCSKQNAIPIFSRQEYVKEVFQMQFTGSVQEIVEASSFWHDNGIILHQKGITMDELYCIDPQWLCATMAKVITVQERNPFQKNGFMHMEDFVRLFKVASAQSFIDAIISIMQSFEIILLLDQQSILIPSLMSRRREHACAISQDDSGKLSVQNSTVHIGAPLEAQKNVLLRHYVLPFIPNGFFSRLASRICANTVIVAHCRSLFGQCDPQLLCWRNGISLVCNGNEVLSISPVTYPLPGTDSTYGVTSAGHEVVRKFSGVEVRVLSVAPDADVGSSPETHAAAWLLQQVVECIDSIFDDWYIAFGRKRGFDLSMILVGAPCNQCEEKRLSDASSITPQRSLSCIYRNNIERVTGKSYFIFSLPFCAHVISMKQELQCPLHGSISASQIAPDLVFRDLPESVVVSADDVAILSLLGKGGFGAVFSGTLGRNVQNSQRIAIKTFTVVEEPSGPVESLAWEKYQQTSREARVISKLVHDNILGLVGVAMAPLMLLLELAPLGDLKACVEKFKLAKARLNVWALSSTLIQVAKALDYIHSRKFIFRDLKPGNILVWKFPLPETKWDSESAVYVKLADYGICQQYTPQGVRGAEGTPPYLPPEVLLHCGQESHSTKLDVYSFGMLMYYLFTFEHPFYDEATRPVGPLLEEGKRPSLSLKQCPPTLGLLELMCWCWSEHPYHRPELKDVISKLQDGVTSQLVTAFPILNADAGINVAAASTRTTSRSFAFSASISVERRYSERRHSERQQGEKQRVSLAPGYLNPFGNTNKTYHSSFKSPAMVLDVWCGGKDGLKHITSQATGLLTEDIEPSEGECISIVSTLNDHVWVSRMVSAGCQLSIYDTKRNCRIAKWVSKECVRKLLYNSTEDIVVATTASSVLFFSNREISDNFNPFLSQPYFETFSEVVLVKVAEKGCEAHLWYSAESKLKTLIISARGITSETYRLYANSIIEHMEPLGEAHEGKLKDLVLSHRGCIEKWDLEKKERTAVCDCYDFCSNLCLQKYDNSKVTALLHWRDVLYIGTEGGIFLILSPDTLTSLWAIQVTETPVRCLAGVSLDSQEVKHGALLERDSETSLIISFGGQYTGMFKGSRNVPPSLKPPGEPQFSYDSTPHIKLSTATSHACHMFVLSTAICPVRIDSQTAKQPKPLKHRPTFYTRHRT